MDTEKRYDQKASSGEMPVKENKMGIMPIPRLLFSMAVPMMVYMMIGFAIGMIMRKNTLLREAPSIRAASSRAFGIVSKKPFAI